MSSSSSKASPCKVTRVVRRSLKDKDSDIFREIKKAFELSRNSERMWWLHSAIVELDEFKVEYSTIKGCMCGSCYGFNITWLDDSEKLVEVSGEDLIDVVEEAMKILPTDKIWRLR